MLRLRFWKPAPGVRSFLIELLIVVLGVLIALAAQQTVEGFKARRDVASFESALAKEIARSVLNYQLRVAQGPCLRARLEALESFHAHWSDGSGIAPTGTIGRPLAVVPNFAVWRAGAGTAELMPLETRLAYADLYDSLERYQRVVTREFAAWDELAAFEGATRLTSGEVNRLKGLILSAKFSDDTIKMNLPILYGKVATLGLDIAAPSNRLTAERVATSRLCEPFSTSDRS